MMTKNKIIHRCNSCGAIEVQKITPKQRAWHVVKLILICLMITTSIFGTIGIYSFLTSGDLKDGNSLVNMGEYYAGIVNIRADLTSQATSEMINFANSTELGCSNQECKAKNLWSQLIIDFKYDNSTRADVNPIKTFSRKQGDCKQMSFLYKTFLKTEGISSRITCDNSHCWVLVNADNKTFIGDITKQRWQEVKA